MDKNILPFKISIASPCPARWEDMGGGEQVRFCDHCRKNVYNLSAMTSAEAAELLRATNGQLCARIYQRADGKVLTADCPVGVAKQWRRVKSLVAGGVALVVMAFVNLSAFGRGSGDNTPEKNPTGKTVAASDDASSGGKLGKIRVRSKTFTLPAVTMGMIAMPIAKTNVPVTPTAPPVKK